MSNSAELEKIDPRAQDSSIKEDASTRLLAEVLGAATGKAEKTGASSNEDPIDQKNDRCQEKDFSTPGIEDCLQQNINDWDAEMNKQYQALKKELPAADFKKVHDAQVSWLKYRDAEFAVIDNMYQPTVEHGHEAPIEGMAAKAEIVSSQAKALRDLRNYE